MKITVQSSKVVKPAYDTTNGSASSPFAEAAVVPLSVFDKVTFDQHIPAMYAFPPPAPARAVLEAGLATALAAHREWAGRRGADACGRPAILLNDSGVRLVEAAADVALGTTPWRPTPETVSLHPEDGGGEEVMAVQVTRFACGSMVVCCRFLHLVGDGHAVFEFVAAWGRATRGVPVDPIPVHDRAALFAPRDPPLVEFQHRTAEFKAPAVGAAERNGHHHDEVVVSVAHFTRGCIAKLKSQAASTGRGYSTTQCVVAHLWRCITRARGLTGTTTTTTLRVAVDGRTRMRRVPAGYTGNVVLRARPRARARDLTARPLGHAAALVSREISRTDGRYFRSFIDFAGSGEAERAGLVPVADAAETVLCPDVEVDSVLGLPWERADFGSGKPLCFVPGYMPLEGVVFVVPSFAGDGSVYAYVPLFSRAVDAFHKCCYSFAGMADARL